jgi:hypothetical protein
VLLMDAYFEITMQGMKGNWEELARKVRVFRFFSHSTWNLSIFHRRLILSPFIIPPPPPNPEHCHFPSYPYVNYIQTGKTVKQCQDQFNAKRPGVRAEVIKSLGLGGKAK